MKNLILQEIRLLKTKQQPKLTPQITYRPQIKQESQLQKTSSSQTASFKSESRAVLGGMDLFKGLVFCFAHIDIELSPKRVECMTRAIAEQGGKVISFKDQQINEEIDYLLINPKVPLALILRKVEKKIVFKEILDFNFVLDSLRQSILLAVSTYSLYRKGSQLKQSEDEKGVSGSIFPYKMVKLQRAQSLQCPKNRNYQKDELLTEDEEQCETQSASTAVQSSQSQCPRVTNSRPNKALNKDAFLCQKGLANGPMQAFSINKFICAELMKLQKIYQNEKDIGRKIAYLKAVSAIRSLDKDIESEHDLENLRGVGSKIIKKVKELLQTGKLQKLQRMQQSEKRMVIEQFSKIWGVGPNKAQELYQKGVRSIEELRGRTQLLNKNQKIGLRYFQDILIKIPREKITRIYAFVRQIFQKLVDNIDNYHLEVCGSYRRGRPLCGDIDILIARKDHIYEKKLLIDLVLELQRQSFLTDHLVFPSPSGTQSSMSYMGICAFEGPTHHRIDIKYYPTLEYPYALLYFTGSDMFNRSMRLYASKIGIQLGDHGAVARRKHQNDALWEKPIPQCLTEEEIFGFLGLDFKTPKERDL